jgi:hypothetical protein
MTLTKSSDRMRKGWASPVREPDCSQNTSPDFVLTGIDPLTNNMDLLDLWKCHICREARHLLLVVPLAVSRTRGPQRVYDPVVRRLRTFFEPENTVNVLSAAVLGYP